MFFNEILEAVRFATAPFSNSKRAFVISCVSLITATPDADIFLILTHCQFEKNNFQNRFNKDSKWYTMCVNKGLDPIYTKIYLSPEKDWKRIKDMLPEYKDVLDLFDDCVDSNLSKMNSNIIFKIKDILNIKTKIIFDYPTELKGTERLVDICLKNGAKTYISGVSGSKYMDINKFSDNNIKVIFQDETKMVKKPIIDILKNKLLNV
mgnify:CR=1 FL=1